MMFHQFFFEKTDASLAIIIITDCDEKNLMKQRQRIDVTLEHPWRDGLGHVHTADGVRRLRRRNHICITIGESRVFWSSLRPCLFESDVIIARRAIHCILENYLSWLEQKLEKKYPTKYSKHCLQKPIFICSEIMFTLPSEQNPGSPTPFVDEEIECPKFCVRLVRLAKKEEYLHLGHKNLLIWMQPPNNTPLEYLWQGLLLRWEHRLIQAQSITGYLATLGGGFFLCHHFHTALVLARQQQRFASLLANDNMYYSCIINQVYNFIYAGHFGVARRLLHQLIAEISRKGSKIDSTIVRMCASARLFLKRMRQASQLTSKSVDVDGQHTKTVDDYQRMRIAHDQSKREDLIIPFQRKL